MQPSAELRWFCRGHPPAGLTDWFRSGDVPPTCEATRDDLYLSLPGCDNLGIKLRQGNVELKRLSRRGGMERLRADVPGRVEEWIKWSFPLAEESSTDAVLAEGDRAWLKVTKTRMLRKYEVTGTEVRVVNGASRVAEGCNLELTTLVISGEAWWTLGFEAFGAESNVERNLRLALQSELADSRFPTMKAEDSYSFPEWLRIINRRLVS